MVRKCMASSVPRMHLWYITLDAIVVKYLPFLFPNFPEALDMFELSFAEELLRWLNLRSKLTFGNCIDFFTQQESPAELLSSDAYYNINHFEADLFSEHDSLYNEIRRS